MSEKERTIVFREKELRGSRLRCLMLTSASRPQVASILTQLATPIAVVDPDRHDWVPKGFLEPDEAKLGENLLFLNEDQRRECTNWWLKKVRGANTPNWDLVSSCEIGGKDGLLLVEAKAHSSELKREGKSDGDPQNDIQIQTAILEANNGLNALLPGWALTKASHYQLCNRFAWTWKVAEMGIPVVLVYLGFLHSDEMRDCGVPFDSAADWEQTMLEDSKSLVPGNAWERRLQTKGAPMWALMRAVDLDWTVSRSGRVLDAPGSHGPYAKATS